MYEKNKWKIIIVLAVFMILMTLENLIYADFFMPYYKLMPEDISAVPDFLLLILYFMHAITNFIIIMILTKVIYEYENLRRIFIGSAITSAFQMAINIPLILSFQSIFGIIEKTTVLECLIEGSGVFFISIIPLAVLSYLVIRYVFNMREMRMFYGLSMGLLLSPVYHYLLFYTPLVRILGFATYMFGI